MSSTSYALRKSKEEVIKEFGEYKKSGEHNIDSLKDLLSHCNVVPEIIESYLFNLQREDNDLFLKELFLYYPILPVEVCQKFNVKKKKSEKDRFFNLIENLLDIEAENENIEMNLNIFLKKEINCYDEIEHLIPKDELEKKEELEKYEKMSEEEEHKNINDENKILELEKEKDKEDLLPSKYSRWLIFYNSKIDFKTEKNEEFLFYYLSNCLISEFYKQEKCFRKRIQLIGNIIETFKQVYPRRNDNQMFSQYFEFLCMALTNCEKNKNYIEKLEPILDSIYKEFNEKYFNLNEIKKFLDNKCIQYECDEKKIIINYKSKKFILDDYSIYNLNENVINDLLSKTRFTYKSFLEKNIRFTEYLKRMRNNELLIEIIKKYSRSNLAISSIEKLIDIQKKDYELLFKELSDNIENYIYLMPYDCFFDTERTFKNPMKVIIDPYKEKYNLERYYIYNNLELESELMDFCNIAFRKFCFEHEIHHLTTVLLFFLYVHEDNRINSIIKELTSDGEVIFHPNMKIEDFINKDKNFQKEAGNIFEMLCYGDIQKRFNLKQLLIIVNEDNDNLNYESFKKKYEEECKKNVKDLLDEFPDNQLLSSHVKKIKEYIEKSPEKADIIKRLNTTLIVSKDEINDNKDIFSILNDDDLILVNEFERYNNQFPFVRRPIDKIKKKNK